MELVAEAVLLLLEQMVLEQMVLEMEELVLLPHFLVQM
tara:strand:+ start:164 stop:277 length:114 start_codon:yes stop_codon:yes gene_type:complete